MPEKLKKSIKIKDRNTGLMKIEHYYLKQTSLSELQRIANDSNANPKLRIKCKKELIKRNGKSKS